MKTPKSLKYFVDSSLVFFGKQANFKTIEEEPKSTPIIVDSFFSSNFEEAKSRLTEQLLFTLKDIFGKTFLLKVTEKDYKKNGKFFSVTVYPG